MTVLKISILISKQFTGSVLVLKLVMYQVHMTFHYF